jgi:hypothetical protein
MVNEKREGKLALTDIGHAIIISHHTIHFVGIGIAESFEVLANAVHQYLVLMVSDTAIIKCGRHIVWNVIWAVQLSQSVLQNGYGC